MNILSSLKSILSSGPRVTPTDASPRVRAGHALLVDVREPNEWTAGVAEHAMLLPLSDLNGARARWRPFLAKVGEREIFVYCASGMRSGTAARLLAGEGFKATNTGGLSDWASTGWRVVAPSSAAR